MTPDDAVSTRALLDDEDPAMHGHLPTRPDWDCLVDGTPWPCDRAREILAAQIGRSRTVMLMGLFYAEAAEELPHVPISELYQRFLGWPTQLPQTGTHP